jgi:hypothetical protein
VFVPIVFYFLFVIFYNYLFYTKPGVCGALSFVCVALSLAMIAQRSNNKMAILFPLGMVCACAVMAGTVGGLYCYDSYGIYSYFYANSRKYTNVVPSEPAAAVTDAGRLTFTDESSVDVTKAVGYAAENGNRYCAAPIKDNTETSHVEYWAVGFNCCGWEGEFNCDDSGDANSHAGIVVFDNNGWFSESNKDYYDDARKKAEAEFDLSSVDYPLYVRWVSEGNLDKLTNTYKVKAWTFIGFSTLFYTCLSAWIGSVMYKMY